MQCSVFAFCFLYAEDGCLQIRGATAAMAVLLATLYGAFDEVHQAFTPNRSPDVRDSVRGLSWCRSWGSPVLLLIAIIRRLRGGDPVDGRD